MRDDSVSAREITKAMQAALNNPALRRDQQETYACRAIPVQNLINAAAAIRKAGFPGPATRDRNYIIHSREGQPTRLDVFYVLALAYNLEWAVKQFNNLCPGANFTIPR
ncbi:hypothetical protein [Candidatus Odyssella thessalonicensis]|uniref:hypothetical protein n=1 Tax=Candidatus Odyssella thessalonicensis TaxID=84647 RepID=UPI000225AF29|nr:hypothetical protein [Candidatus Odyssella thessalonicensis]